MQFNVELSELAGQKLSLSKEGLTKANVGLGWLVNQYDTG